MTRSRDCQRVRAIVTGASSGIGRALAIQLAQRGAQVLVNARREQPLQELASCFPEQIQPAVGDITDPATRHRLLEAAQEAWGRVDLLVNNAGVGAMGRFEEADESRLRRIMDVNFFAPVELTRAAFPALAASPRGCVMNISSVLGHRAVPWKSEYCASKFALHGWSDSLRAEWSSRGIDVLLVSPSTTDTEFFDHALEDRLGRRWKGRHATPPEHVARIALRAWKRRRHEVLISPGGRALVWLDRLAPTWTDRILARWG